MLEDKLCYRWCKSGVEVTPKERVRFIHCDEQVGIKFVKNGYDYYLWRMDNQIKLRAKKMASKFKL